MPSPSRRPMLGIRTAKVRIPLKTKDNAELNGIQSGVPGTIRRNRSV